MSVLQRIAEVEAEIARTQKNKATNYHLGLLKAKLAKLRAQLIEGSTKKGAGAGGEGFDISKTGDARVGLVGFPSVGKSTLLNKLTGTYSEVAAYEFTTLTCVPGVFKYKGARVQLLDLPGIIEGAKDGKGRGKQVIGVARTCSLILVVLDVMKPLTHKHIIERELEGFGIRLNKLPPNITFKKKDKGGISVTHTVPLTNIDEETIKSICHEYRITNAQIALRCDATADDVIDVIEGNRLYIPCLYVMNKIDQITIEELDLISRVPHYVPISAHHELDGASNEKKHTSYKSAYTHTTGVATDWNLDGLLEKIWQYLDLVRVYTKPKGQIPDYNAPVILSSRCCKVEDFCLRIHRSLLDEFKHAIVWGRSVKHNPQKVGKDHELVDEDVVQIVKK